MNVLFLAAGRRVSLLRMFKSALADLGFGGRVISEDAAGSAPAHVVADARAQLPRCSEPHYIARLRALCLAEQIKLVVPLIDTVLPVLAPHKADFAAAGITLAVSSPATIALGHDKVLFGEFLRANGFATPHVLSAAEVGALTDRDLPVFAKPRSGSASIGAEKVTTLADLEFLRGRWPDLMVMELVTGPEFTIDVYVDRDGVPRCAVPRRRLEVRAGEVSKGLTVRDPAIIEAALALCARLPGPPARQSSAGRSPGAVGCLTLQCFKRDGGPRTGPRADEVTFIELNPRFGGGYPLAFHAGANFPRWLLQEAQGHLPDYAGADTWRDNLAMLRYDDELIVDGSTL